VFYVCWQRTLRHSTIKHNFFNFISLRSAVKCEISFVLSDAVLRKKWSYLSKKFIVEYRKIKPPRSGDPGGETYEPKWPQYRSLLFLKYIVEPRASSSNVNLDESAPVQPNPIPSNDETVDNVQSGDSGDHDDRGDSVVFNVNDNEDLGITLYSTRDENRSLVQDNPRKRKRTGLNAKDNKNIIALETQNAKVLEKAMKNRQPENKDLLFFRSFLPHVNKIPANMKLRFRNRIQQLADEFAYHQTFPTFPLLTSSPSTSSAFNRLSASASPPMPEYTLSELIDLPL
jgi:hypothetical protein